MRQRRFSFDQRPGMHPGSLAILFFFLFFLFFFFFARNLDPGARLPCSTP